VDAARTLGFCSGFPAARDQRITSVSLACPSPFPLYTMKQTSCKRDLLGIFARSQKGAWFQIACVVMMVSSGLITLTGRGLLSVLQGVLGIIFAVEGISGFTTRKLDVVKRFRVLLVLYLIFTICIGILNLATINQYCSTAEDKMRCDEQSRIFAYILLGIGLPTLILFFCFVLRYIGQRDSTRDSIDSSLHMHSSVKLDRTSKGLMSQSMMHAGVHDKGAGALYLMESSNYNSSVEHLALREIKASQGFNSHAGTRASAVVGGAGAIGFSQDIKYRHHRERNALKKQVSWRQTPQHQPALGSMKPQTNFGEGLYEDEGDSA